MTTLEKLARSTLVSLPAPPAPHPATDRVIKVTTLVPLYSQSTLPVSQAQPGDEIVVSSNFMNVTIDGVTTRKFVTTTFAIRRTLIGYNNVVTYQVVPGGGATVPVVPPAVVTPVPSAWDATAWSIAAIPDPLEATWKVGPSTAANSNGTGALVGLTYFAPTPGQEQRGIIHGIRVENGVAYVHTAPPEGVPSAPSFGEQILVPFLDVTDSDEMKIKVEGGKVSYYAAGILLATGPSYLGSQSVRLGSVLFNPTDTVLDPAITSLVTTNGKSALRVVGLGGEVFNSGKAVIKIGGSGYEEKNRSVFRVHGMGGARPMGTGRALFQVVGQGWGDYVGTGQGGSMLRVIGIGGDYPYGFGESAIILRSFGNGVAPNTNLRARAVPIDSMDADTAPGKHGGHYPVIDVDSSFDATVITSGALRETASVLAKMRVNNVYAASLSAAIGIDARLTGERVVDVALIVDVQADATQLTVLVITASLDASADVQADLTTTRVTDAKLGASAGVQFDWTAGRVLNAAFASLARAGVAIHMPGENLQVWSVNEETSGSTAYEQYPFNSFACIGGRYFGAAPGGIFELVGDTDDGGQQIDAVVNLGKRDFGTNALKGITNAYLTAASPEKMAVRVTTPEGQQYTYETRRSDDYMRTQRADFGRGLRAHYLGLEIMNTNGADFDLESAQFLVAEFKRRI